MNLLKLINKTVGIVKKRYRIIYPLIISFFVIGFLLGLYSGIYLKMFKEDEANKFVSNLKDFIVKPLVPYASINFFLLIPLIFLLNLRTNLIITASGFSYVLPFFIALGNGAVLGLLLGIKVASSAIPLPYVLGMLAVVSIELIAMSLSTTEGLYLATSAYFPKKVFGRKIKRKEAFIRTLKETLHVYILILLLLFLGAIIEVVFIYLMGSSLIFI